MAFLTLLILSFNSIFFFINVLSNKPLWSDLVLKLSLLPSTEPETSEFFHLLEAIKEDIRSSIGLEWVFIVFSTLASMFLATSIVIAAAVCHGGRSLLSFRKLLWATVALQTRPFFTLLYNTVLRFGYFFLFLANLFPFLLLVQQTVTSKVLLSTVITILASVLYIYLNVTWNLGFVVSVLEEKSGSEAIGKAAKIIKGKRLHGFILNLVFMILTLVIFLSDLTVKLAAANSVIIGFFVTVVLGLVNILRWMAYTILYYQCKKNHGEEVELPWSKGYSQVPIHPLLNDNEPSDHQEEACDA
ncbi:uncharacterized protein LOC123205090 [Mangifera indica]|uniref:uncharacterized protein LOC123205090 n=1 Tax=Mangifera indica TaxID=29780 RepID=UPI001CFA1B8E|nr:uncharacterized protein LOC123205090 [Mangifera indica]